MKNYDTAARYAASSICFAGAVFLWTVDDLCIPNLTMTCCKWIAVVLFLAAFAIAVTLLSRTRAAIKTM